MQSLISGIYWIRNKQNNKIYIGSSKNIRKRFLEHKWALKNNKHLNNRLQNSFNKYGLDSFEFLIILKCHPDMLIWYEQQFLDQCKPDYNIAPNAYSVLGRKHTDKTKKLLSEKIGKINRMDYRIEQTILSNKLRKGSRNLGVALANKNRTWSQDSVNKRTNSIAKYYDIILIHKSGEIVRGIKNLAKFCDERGLERSGMYRLINDELKKSQGWSKCSL